MAYDEKLADRVRELLGDRAGITEKKMFGGLAFLIRGHMALAASGQGGILVRVDPAQADKLAARPDVEAAVMRGRTMRGWLRVTNDAVGSKRKLQRWVEHGVTYASSLPAK